MRKNVNQVENNRLKRLKLKLMNYRYTLEYLPGKYKYMANLLTRNIIHKEENDDATLRYLMHTVKVTEIRYSIDKLVELKIETNRDRILSRVKDYYLNYWPNKLKEVGEMNHFYKIRSDLTVEDVLVYFENRVIIKTTLRYNMLKQLHDSHQGVCKIKELAKQYIYWPGIVSDTTNLVLACTICNKYTKSNKRNVLLNHEMPDVQFDKVGADIASYRGKDYLIIVDHYSKWVEACKLKWKTALGIKKKKKCKKVFARFGVPRVFVVDNMPFSSIQFREFAKEWGIQIMNRSPNYPVSNGLAEKNVGIIKKNDEEVCRYE